MSILNDLETTLDTGTNYATRNKIFDVLFDDMVKLLNSDLETQSILSHRFIFFSNKSYINRIKSIARQSFSMVRLYELLNHFGLSDNELKVFLESDYIHINQTEYRAYDMEYGTIIDFNSASGINLIYKYFENPETVTEWYARYAHIDFCKKFARAFRMQILSLNVIASDRFWTEFSEYISKKPVKLYSGTVRVV